MSKVGAHVSAAVSLDLSIERAQHLGGECTQIFISPPQQWIQAEHQEEEIESYKLKVSESGINPNFIHATYLINLATSNPEHLKKSVDWLIYALQEAVRLNSQGVILHLGSHRGSGFEKVFEIICDSVIKVLSNLLNDSSKNVPNLILENCAGSGGTVGCKFAELGRIIKAVNYPNLKACLDTQHAFAAGYDLRTASSIKGVLGEFDSEIGLNNLVCIHANDSKTALGSNVDRHENIGEGFIGKEAFGLLLNHPQLKHLPFILEVPGFANTGPDKENIDILKSLLK